MAKGKYVKGSDVDFLIQSLELSRVDISYVRGQLTAFYLLGLIDFQQHSDLVEKFENGKNN